MPLLTAVVPGLICDQPLCELGYALNEEVKAVICVGCNRGVPVDMLRTHSISHHKGRKVLPSEEHTGVVQRLSDAGYRTSKFEKYHQPPAQKPVDGLEVLNGFRCPFEDEDGSRCSKAFLAPSTFNRHLSDHPNRPKLDPSSCIASVQTLFTQGNLHRYFSVDPSLSNLDPSSTTAYAFAIKMLETMPKAQIAVSDHDKDRASIHWYTRWPDLLKPYFHDNESMNFLRSLVAFPEPRSDPEWLMKILDHGRRWWKDAEDAHTRCSYRASVMLKSHKQ